MRDKDLIFARAKWEVSLHYTYAKNKAFVVVLRHINKTGHPRKKNVYVEWTAKETDGTPAHQAVNHSDSQVQWSWEQLQLPGKNHAKQV